MVRTRNGRKTANKQIILILNEGLVNQFKLHDNMLYNILKLHIKKRFEA